MKKHILSLLALSLCMAGMAQATIEPSLQREMNQRGNDERIKISIVMTEQSRSADLLAVTNTFATNAERRAYVRETLKRQAEASQADLLSLLEEMERNGMVTEIRPLWLVNTISCHATKAAINSIATRRDISTVYYCEPTFRTTSQHKTSATPNRGTAGIAEHVTVINADQVWEQGYTGQGVVVACIDSGINYDHSDFQGQLWDGGEEFPNHGYDVFYHDNDPRDHLGHGTRTGGIIVGNGTSGTQTGVAPGARLMSLKVSADDEDGCDMSQYVEALQFAIEHDAQLVSVSMGQLGSDPGPRILARQSCENALAAGIVGVFSAGNMGGELSFLSPVPFNVGAPGSCPPPYMHPDQAGNPGGATCVICVGAVDYDDHLLSLSSRGPSTWADIADYGDYPYNPGIGLIKPDVCAPGVDIVSLDYNNINGYNSDSGTSFSAPCVTGAIALMLSKNPDLTPAQIDEILETTALKFTEHKSNDFGSGRIDALAAVNAVTLPGETCSINATVDPAEGGTINGTGTYAIGQQVTLSVETFTDYVFENWTENDEVVSTEATYTFTATGNRNLVANLIHTEGINESVSNAEVYPNPSTGSFTVKCADMTGIRIFALDGKLVRTIETANGTCHVDGLDNGVYLLKINTKNGTLVQKIVKY